MFLVNIWHNFSEKNPFPIWTWALTLTTPEGEMKNLQNLTVNHHNQVEQCLWRTCCCWRNCETRRRMLAESNGQSFKKLPWIKFGTWQKWSFNNYIFHSCCNKNCKNYHFRFKLNFNRLYSNSPFVSLFNCTALKTRTYI